MVLDPALFDMYYLLVEVLFGSILWAGIAVLVVYVIMMVLLKMSPLLQMYILILFIITFGIGYGGSIFAVFGFIFSFMYFAQGLIRFIIGKVLL